MFRVTRLFGFTLVVLLIIGLPLFAQEAKKEESKNHAFVGVQKCKICHMSAKKGNQYAQWQSSKHAKAYETLATDESKAAAKKAGIEGDPQKSPKCLKCHVTAYGVASELLGEKYKVEDGVGCESCHGAGADYAPIKIMKVREEAVKNGLMIPDEEVCLKCHNKESPVFKGFDYKAYKAKIEHPMPKM